MFVLVVWFWLLFRIYNTEASHLDLKILKPDTKGRSVNLALETVVEFDNQDKAENIKFLDNVKKLIGKVKTAITNNNKARREFSDSNVETFTDFVLHAIDVLNSYPDKDLEDFFSILNDEVRQYHYRGCKFHELTDNYGLRTFLADKLDAAKNVKVTDLRDTLATLSDKIEKERYDKFERILVDFVESLYNKDSIDNLKKFLNEINDFKANKGSNTDLVNIIKEGLRSIVFNHYTNLNNNARVEFKNKVYEYWDNYSKQLNTHGAYKHHDKNDLAKQGIDSLAYFRYPKKGNNTSTSKSPKKKVKPLKQVHVEKVKYNPRLFTTTKKETTTMKKLTFMTLYPEFETHGPGQMISETKKPRFKSQFETNQPNLKPEHDRRPKSKLKIEMKLKKWKGRAERHELDKIQPNVKIIPQQNAFIDYNEHQRHEPYEILLPKRLNQETNTEHSRKQSSKWRAQKYKSTPKKPISIGYLTEEISNTIKRKLAKLNKKLETEHISKYLKEMPEPKSKEYAENFRSHSDTKDEHVIARIQNLESELRNVKTQLENDTKLKNKVKETDSRRTESGMNKYYFYETKSKQTTEKVKNAYLGDFDFNAHIEVERPKNIYNNDKAKTYTKIYNYYAKDKNQMNVKSNTGKGKEHEISAKKYSLHYTDDKRQENAFKPHVSSRNQNKYKKYQLHTARERKENSKKAFNKYENHRNQKYHDDIKMNSVHDLIQDDIQLDNKKNYYMQPWSGPSLSKQYRHSKRKEYLKNINENKSYKSPDLARKVSPSVEKKYYDERKSKAEIQFVPNTETNRNKNRYNVNKKNKYDSNRHITNHNNEKRKEKTTDIAFYRKMINDDEHKIQFDPIGNKERGVNINIHEPNSNEFEKHSEKIYDIKSYKDKANVESNLDANKKYGSSSEENSYKNKKVFDDNDMSKRNSADNDVESAKKYKEDEHIEKYPQSYEKEKERTYDNYRIDTAAEDQTNDLEDPHEKSNEIPIQHPNRKYFKQNNEGIVKNYYSVKDMFSNKDENEKEGNIQNLKNSEGKYENQPFFEQGKNIVVSDSVKQVAIKDVINITAKEVYYTTYPTTIIGIYRSLEYNKQGPVIESQTDHAVNKYENNKKKHKINIEISNTFDPNTQVSPSEIRKPVSELSSNKTTNKILYKTYTEKNMAHDIQYLSVSKHINNQTYHDENKNKIESNISDKIINAELSYDSTTPFIRVENGQDECNKSNLKSSLCKNNELELSKHSLRKDIQYKSDVVKDTVKERLPDLHEQMPDTNLAHTFGLNKRFKKVLRVTDSYSKKKSEAVSEVTKRVEKDREIKHDGQSVENKKDIPTKITSEKDDHVQRTNQKVLPKDIDSNQKYSVRYEKIFDVDDLLFKKTDRLYESDKNTATDIEKQNDGINLQFHITTVSNERKISTDWNTFDSYNQNALYNDFTGHPPITLRDRNDVDVKYQTQEKSNTDILKVKDAYNHDKFTEMKKISPDAKIKSNVNQADNGGHQLTGHITDKIRVEFKNGEIHISNNSNLNTFKADNEIPEIDNIRDMTNHDNNIFLESNRKSGSRTPVGGIIENDININNINNTLENGKVVGHLKAEISADVLKALENAPQSHEDMNDALKQNKIANESNSDFKKAINIDKYYPKSDKNTDFAEFDNTDLGFDTYINRRQTDTRLNIDKGKSDTLISKHKDKITTTKIHPLEKDNGNYDKEMSNYDAKLNNVEQQAKLFPEVLQGKANRRFSNDFERAGQDKYKGIDKILRGPKIDQADLEAHMNDIWESMNHTGFTDKMPEMPIRMAVSDDVLLASDTPPPFLEPQRKVFAPTAPAPLTTIKIYPPTPNSDPFFGTLFPQNNFDDIENQKEVTEVIEQTLSPTDNPLRATNYNDSFNPSNLFNNDFNDEMGPKIGAFVPPIGINNEIGKIAGVDSVEALKSKVSERLNLSKRDLKTEDLDPFLTGIAPMNMGEPPDARRNLFASHTEAHRDVDSKEIFEDPILKDMDRDMQI